VGSLLDRSLLRMKHRKGVARFSMLRFLRRFAQSFSTPEQKLALGTRHARHFGKWAITPRMGPRFEWAEWWNKREREERNFQQAMQFSLVHKSSDLAVLNGLSLARVWFIRQRHAKTRTLLQQLLSLPGIGQRNRAPLRLLRGKCDRTLGSFGPSQEILELALTDFEALEDRKGISDAIREIGMTLGCLDEIESALSHTNRAAAVARGCGDLRREALARKAQADLLINAKRFDESVNCLKPAIKTLRMVNDLPHLSQALSSMGRLAYGRGNAIEAVRCYRQALQVSKQIGFDNRMGMLWMDLGRSFLLDGSLESAEAAFTKAARKLKRMGAWRKLCLLYSHIAEIRMTKGLWAEVQKIILLCEQLHQRHPDPQNVQTIQHLQDLLVISRNQDTKKK